MWSLGTRLNPDFVLDFVIACPDGYREELKIQMNQEFCE